MDPFSKLLAFFRKELTKESEESEEDQYKFFEIFIDIPTNKTGDDFKVKYLVKLINVFQAQNLKFSIRQHYTIHDSDGKKLSGLVEPMLSLYHRGDMVSYTGGMTISDVWKWIKSGVLILKQKH